MLSFAVARSCGRVPGCSKRWNAAPARPPSGYLLFSMSSTSGSAAHPVRKAAGAHIETVREFLRGLAADAGVHDADAFARQLQMVMMGSIVAAYAGDRDAARRAKEIGLLLLARAGVRTGKGAQA